MIATQLYSATRWSQADSSFARGDRSNYSREMYLTIDKTQRYSFLSMSATLSSLYEGWLCFSVTHSFPIARFFHAASRMVNYCSTVTPTNKRLRERKNDGCTHMRTSPVPRNGVKTETFSPQNDHAMELNITFLLTAAVDWSVHLHKASWWTQKSDILEWMLSIGAFQREVILF